MTFFVGDKKERFLVITLYIASIISIMRKILSTGIDFSLLFCIFTLIFIYINIFKYSRRIYDNCISFLVSLACLLFLPAHSFSFDNVFLQHVSLMFLSLIFIKNRDVKHIDWKDIDLFLVGLCLGLLTISNIFLLVYVFTFIFMFKKHVWKIWVISIPMCLIVHLSGLTNLIPIYRVPFNFIGIGWQIALLILFALCGMQQNKTQDLTQEKYIKEMGIFFSAIMLLCGFGMIFVRRQSDGFNVSWFIFFLILYFYLQIEESFENIEFVKYGSTVLVVLAFLHQGNLFYFRSSFFMIISFLLFANPNEKTKSLIKMVLVSMILICLMENI